MVGIFASLVTERTLTTESFFSTLTSGAFTTGFFGSMLAGAPAFGSNGGAALTVDCRAMVSTIFGTGTAVIGTDRLASTAGLSNSETTADRGFATSGFFTSETTVDRGAGTR